MVQILNLRMKNLPGPVKQNNNVKINFKFLKFLLIPNFIIIFTFLSSVGAEEVRPSIRVFKKVEWFMPPEKVKGVALIVHGLNMLPTQMNSLAQFLGREGIQTLRISLAGHLGYEEDLLKIDESSWIKDIAIYYHQVNQVALKNQVPLFFVGYSLGALANLNLMDRSKNFSFQKMIFFAPAIEVRWYTSLLKIFSIFGQKFKIPSRAPKEYRLYDGLPLQVYGILDSLLENFDLNKAQFKIPTLIFIDPKDELIDAQKLRNRLEVEGLKMWEILPISNSRSSLSSPYHHLIIDGPSLGWEEWARVQRQIKDFLNLKD